MRNFRNYKVWQDAMETAKLVYNVTRLLPKEERYALSDQLRRASISIPSNIAEGAGRGSEADFKNFLNIALGSAYETETQLLLVTELGLLEEKETTAASNAIKNIEKQLTLMIKELS